MARSNKEKIKNNIPRQPTDVPKGTSTFITSQTKNALEYYQQERLNFSFALFDRTHERYNCGGVDETWFVALLDRLRVYSEMELSKFHNPHFQSSNYIHTNSIEEVENELNIPEETLTQIKEDNTFYQLGVSKARGRIHGILINNTFFIIWLDPHHNFIPMKQHGGLKIFPPPKTEIEVIEEQLKECQKEYAELEKAFLEYIDSEE